MTTEQQIAQLGWTLAEPFPGQWCAFMRHFCTPLRDTPEQVLADLKKLKQTFPKDDWKEELKEKGEK